MATRRKRPPKPRSLAALVAITRCKGGPMRDRRLRRPKEAERRALREDDG